MPQPCYVLCCAITAEDQFTNSVSCIHLIEGLQQVQAHVPVQGQPFPFPISVVRIISAWVKSEDDAPNMRFEVQNVFVSPDVAEQVVGTTEFFFNGKTHQRVLSPVFLPAGLQPGMHYVESRIRRLGEDAWLHRQRYPILVKPVLTTPEPLGPTAPPADPPNN